MKWRLVVILAGCCCLASCGGDEQMFLVSARLGSTPAVPAWVVQVESTVPLAIKNLVANTLSPTEHIIHAITNSVAATGEIYHRLVIFDAATQQIKKIAATADGKLTTEADLLEPVIQAALAKYGAMDPALHAKVSADPAKAFDVVITYDCGGLPPRPVPSDPVKYAAHRKAIELAVKPQGDLLEKELTSSSATILARRPLTPVIIAKVSGSYLLSKLRWHPKVESIVEHELPVISQPRSWVSTNDLYLGQFFYYQSPGYFGEGIRAGMLHEGRQTGCGISNSMFFYPGGVQYLYGLPSTCQQDSDCHGCDDTYEPWKYPGRCVAGRCTIWHGTMVAGMIGHLYGFEAKGAPAVMLYMSAYPTTTEEALTWMMEQGVTVVNKSSSVTPDYNPVKWEQYFSARGLSILEASGNGGESAETMCRAPGNICVAGYETLGPPAQFWHQTSTKNISNCSQWMGGTCDREDPQVTFHAKLVHSTTNDPNDPDDYADDQGTSFAAPAGAGLVALMQDRWPGQFYQQPEMIRAALLASGRDVYVHPDYPYKHWSDCYPPDEKDGQGVPDTATISGILNYGRYNAWQLRRNSSFQNNKKTLGTFNNAYANTRWRVVISWLACPDDKVGSSPDIDLNIYGPSGGLQVAGISYDGSWEIVDFIAGPIGTYTIGIQKYGWNDCAILGGSDPYTFLALAYSELAPGQ